MTGVELLDAHSGTTGRARIGLAGHPELPPTVFVKLQPFSPEQRRFLRGGWCPKPRLYESVGTELPVRIPRVWHAACDAADGSFVMVLEDLAASGCRFPTPADDDMLDVATSLVDELAVCTPPTGATCRGSPARRHAAQPTREVPHAARTSSTGLRPVVRTAVIPPVTFLLSLSRLGDDTPDTTLSAERARLHRSRVVRAHVRVGYRTQLRRGFAFVERFDVVDHVFSAVSSGSDRTGVKPGCNGYIS